MYPRLDYIETKSAKTLERGAADARGPLLRSQVRGLLT